MTTAPADLFADAPHLPGIEELGPGAQLLRGFALGAAADLLSALGPITALAPFRHMLTPGGFRMSVAMTNCGQYGWVSDRRGYRYDPRDRESGLPWPEMPAALQDLAGQAAAVAGFVNFVPDVCLINRYQPGTKLSLHQDKDERDFGQPIVSVSLGLPAIFLWGGAARAERPRRLALTHGDVLVWGGPARLHYHGVAPLKPGDHPQLGACRINLTFRRAN